MDIPAALIPPLVGAAIAIYAALKKRRIEEQKRLEKQTGDSGKSQKHYEPINPS